MKNYLIYSMASFLMIVMVGLSSCQKDEPETPAPVAGFTFTGAGGNAPCEVAFTNASTNATSYVWDFGDGTETSTEKSPQHTYTSGGTFTVQLTATGDGGANSITKTINISDPVGPIANFTFTGAGGFAPCTVTFSNSSTDATSYVWDFGDGTPTSTATNPTHTFNIGGVFSVTLTATSSVGVNSITKNVNIENAPTKMKIDKLVILDYPSTNSSGSGWDFLDGPDIYWKLMNQSETTTYFTSGILYDAIYSNLPFTYTNGLPYTITDLTKTYSFEFYDDDYPDADDNINYQNYCYISPSDFTDYPSVIHFDNGEMKFDLYVTWANSKKSFSKNGIEKTVNSRVSK